MASDGKLLYPLKNKEETNTGECSFCHQLCSKGCYGPKKTECFDCKFAKIRVKIPNNEGEGDLNLKPF